MTVQELIEKLKKLPADAVVLDDPDGLVKRYSFGPTKRVLREEDFEYGRYLDDLKAGDLCVVL